MSQALPPMPPPPLPPSSAPSTSPYATRRPQRTGFAVAVLSGALLVGGSAGFAGAALWTTVSDDTAGSPSSSLAVADTPDAPAAAGSVEEVAAKVLPSVVKLDVSGGQGGGSGSGVVLDADGLILTNDHVVSLGGSVDPSQASITVSFNDGTKSTASLVGTDPLTDTALVKVDGATGLAPITIGKSGNLDVGEQVVAIGSPFGLDSTVTSGIVSALDRPVDVGQDAQGNITAYPAIQTDAAINPGNSGGALVDMNGNLVGINASIRSTGSANTEAGSIGLGFAIPVDEILPIVEQLEAGEAPTHARLGISVSDVPAQAGVPAAQVVDGALIRNVGDGSAAGAAGLRAGDVITRIDEHQVSGADSLIATIRAYRPGDRVTVTYERSGKERTTTLDLGSDADAGTS
ncbi:PDZ domain-containing protein [Nocardioides sp. GY 10113]|uniref:S1C family serine protease n=1 Tax=Nocardioides sp. GY 10113 TaxID=2569761 RepID=UPI0010A797E0|nr:trypsin-like peptidase domain-containing protein [Nocardioides sp. GY 10113]TIC79663.1 PDZ domain-containing protein [Nocardioides sp. GY 10113]TIC85788.1 PDZ domain-containing protein [Nocardioides sp. GY 10113]